MENQNNNGGPTFGLSVEFKINLGNYQSATVSGWVSNIPVGADVESIAAAAAANIDTAAQIVGAALLKKAKAVKKECAE